MADAGSLYEPFPLTDQQHAYLVGRTGTLELGNVSTHAYYEYEGELDLARFDRAWQRAIGRHGMLRAVVDPARGTQRVLREAPPFAAEVHDLRGLPVDQVAHRLAGLRERMSHEVRPADTYPLFGVAVSRLGGDRARVHVSFDGLTLDYLSWQLLVADLTRYYDDPDADLPPLELTFRDYVLAMERGRGTDQHRRAQEYWRGRLPDLPPAPSLPVPTDPRTITHPRWRSRYHRIDPAQWSRLKGCAGEAGLTPTALTLAVFAEVLAVWSEQPRFTVNLPRMNRQPLHPQVNEILGEFASFSLLEVDHRGDEPFRERARRLQARLWEDLTHQQVSGVEVLRELIRAQGGFHRALMPVVFTSTLGFTAGERPLLGGRLERVFAISQTPQVYLDVQIEENAGALVYNWDSVDEIFPPGLVDDMFTAYGTLLARLAHDPSVWAATDLALVPEHHHSRGGIAGPARPVPEVLVQSLFERQVRERPDAPAVITSGVTLTYAELSRRANQVAHWLRSRSSQPARPVAVVLPKGAEQAVAAYGALFAGAPYLPVDASQPPARIARLLAEGRAGQVLTVSPVAERLTGLAGVDEPAGPAVLCLDALPAGLPDTALPATQSPDDLAYLLFTSGSTGRPKGVMISHRGMVNCLRATIDEFGVGPDDRCLAVTALHHDMSTFDLFGVLGAGGTMVVPGGDRARDAAEWGRLIAAHGVTIWNSVPAMMEMLLEEPATLSTLRLAFLGGDWIPLRLPGTLRERASGAQVVSVGGPTETTLWNIWHRISEVAPHWRSVPYGRPIANTRYYILDPSLRDRPDGITGELYCAGPGVARGYWHDEERTRRAFLRHPVTGERLYRTGDLGRCLPDGSIEYVGRADSQVKIRGQRIEPGEVEAALAALPGVRGAVVTAVPHQGRPGYRALAGHVTPEPGAVLEPEALTTALRAELPQHLVPATVAVLPRFPLTGNGKVDRAALAASAATAAPPPAGYGAACGPDRDRGQPAGTALETVIAQVWGEALGVARVGVHDDFFALGGDSVLATRIVVRLREALDEPGLGLLSVFTTLTVAQLAEAMTAAEAVPGRLERVAEVYLEVAALTEDQVEAELMRP